jgi:hypothetical protein
LYRIYFNPKQILKIMVLTMVKAKNFSAKDLFKMIRTANKSSKCGDNCTCGGSCGCGGGGNN